MARLRFEFFKLHPNHTSITLGLWLYPGICTKELKYISVVIPVKMQTGCPQLHNCAVIREPVYHILAFPVTRNWDLSKVESYQTKLLLKWRCPILNKDNSEQKLSPRSQFKWQTRNLSWLLFSLRHFQQGLGLKEIYREAKTSWVCFPQE